MSEINNLSLSVLSVKPKISIIIPVYNVEAYLAKCLDSVLQQSYENWECVCIDDGSKDGSGAILDKYARLDSRFKVLHQENAGAHAARNKALEVITGDWIGFVDSDDQIAANWLSEVIWMVVKEQPCAVRLNYLTGQEPPQWFRDQEGHSQYKVYHGADALRWGWDAFFHYGFMCMTFIRRDLIKGIKFRPTICCKEDSIWLLELLPFLTKICVSSFKGYFYRMTTGSLSRGKRVYTQCTSYIAALGDIWKSQFALSQEIHAEDKLKECIRFCATYDVIQWLALRRTIVASENHQVHNAYLALRQTGALTCRNVIEWRYRFAFWWWVKTRQTFILNLVEQMLMVFRKIRSLM